MKLNGKHYKSVELSRLLVAHGEGILRQACADLDLVPEGDNLNLIAAECGKLEPKH